MSKKEEEFDIIETVDEEGNLVNFALIDIAEVDEQEYAILSPVEIEADESEFILMKLLKDGDEYVFEALEDEDEFNRVAEYIENIEE